MNILEISASMFYGFIGIYFLTLTLEKVIPYLHQIYSGLKYKSSSGLKEETGVEYAESPTPVKPKYDVEAFYERMRVLEDSVKNNFFDYEMVKEEQDVAGVEVITNDYEIFLDKNRR